MEGINAGRKTIPFARFDAKRMRAGPGKPPILPHRVG